MMLRFLHWQGIAGIGVALVLLAMLTVQKLEAVRWQKESDRFETLYRDEQAAFAVPSPIRAPLLTPPAQPIARTPIASSPNSAPSTKGPPVISKPALMLPALTLTACASTPKVQPIPVLAEMRQCPAYPLPPETLLKAPAKIDFLAPTR